MPGLCADCVDNCHDNHAVSTRRTQQGFCLCHVQENCLCHSKPGDLSETVDEYSQLTPLFEMLLASASDESIRSFLSTACDHYGYVVIQHVLQRLRAVGAQSTATAEVPQIVGKTLVKSASMRINKSGSVEVRCQPRHPHLPVVLALAAPYVWSMQHFPATPPAPGATTGLTASGGQSKAPLHPLGPHPLDRVVHPTTLLFAARAGLSLCRPILAAKRGGDPWYSLLTQPAWDVVTGRHGDAGRSVVDEWRTAQAASAQLLCATPFTSPPLFPASMACAAPPVQAATCSTIRTVQEGKAWICDLLTGTVKPPAVGLHVRYAAQDANDEAPSVRYPERRTITSVTVAVPTGPCVQLLLPAVTALDAEEAEEDYSLLLCLLPLLLDPCILKCIPRASEALMWLDSCCGLKAVHVYDPCTAVDELGLALATAQGMRVRDWGETGRRDRSAYYSCRLTHSLCEYLSPALSRGAGPAPADLQAWVRDTAQPDALVAFLYGSPEQTGSNSLGTGSHAALGCLYASAVLDTFLAGQGQVHPQAGAALQGIMQRMCHGQLQSSAFVHFPSQHRARLRSQLSVLRVAPYDAFQRLILHARLLVPPWYFTCKACGQRGHFEMDCPTVVEAWR